MPSKIAIEGHQSSGENLTQVQSYKMVPYPKDRVVMLKKDESFETSPWQSDTGH